MLKTPASPPRSILGGRKLVFALTATCCFLALALTPAKADSFQFQLTSDHCTGTGGCLGGQASAGTITVTDVSTGVVHVNITLNSGFQFVSTGFQTDIGFNLAGNPTITFSGVTSGFTPNANPETAGSLHMDGAGDFEYGLMCTACGSGGSNPQPGPLNFTISNGAGLSAASFETNADGQFFAVDLLGHGNTGAVDASTRVVVPEPGTMALLGTGLLGSVGLIRRKLKR